LLRALDVLGSRPLAVPLLSGDGGDRPSWLAQALRRSRAAKRESGKVRVDRCLRFGSYGRPLRVRATSHEALLYWDSDEISAEMGRKLAEFDVVYGVSGFVTDVIRSSTGLPARTLPHGIWPAECTYSPAPADGPTRFLHLGQVCHRKGTDLLLRAFRAAFPRSMDDVRLVVKTWPGQARLATAWWHEFGGADARISLDCTCVRRADLSAYFQRCHAVVMPSRCEGFGMVGLEALAHGRPLIATAWSGPLDYLGAGCLSIAAPRRVPAEHYPGDAREPDFDELVAALRAVHADRHQHLALAAAQRADVLERWSWPTLVEQHWLAPKAESAEA